MKTISLRYTDKFAPDNGTINAHIEMLKTNGFVWYGKMGAPVSKHIAQTILSNHQPKFLLIHSGFADRYWVYIDDIKWSIPSSDSFPKYYQDMAHNFNTWFRVIKIENAEKDVMAKCVVSSSGNSLSEASRHSMSPYFIIDYNS